MSQFRVQSFKQVIGSDREFSNTYLVEAPDLDTVAAVLSDVGNQESHVFLDNVQVTRIRASDTTPDTDVFTIVTLNVTGDRGTAADGDWLPLFNCFRVDCDVAGGGRPSRKYYRGPLLEADQQAGFLDTGVIDNIDTQVGQLITIFSTGGCPWVDPDGQEITAVH